MYYTFIDYIHAPYHPLAHSPHAYASPFQIVTTFGSLREENAEMKTRMATLKGGQEALQVNAHMHNRGPQAGTTERYSRGIHTSTA